VNALAVVGLEVGVLGVVGGVRVRSGKEGAVVEGGAEAEGVIEGGGQVRDEGLQGTDEVELRLAAGVDGLLQGTTLLAHGGEV
jgi:hypothetical protein